VVRYLSQSEIDAILQYVRLEQSSLTELGLGVGTMVRPYDFSSSTRISKHALRAMHGIHETFQHHLISAWSGQLRTMVEVELVSIDQLTYQEYVLSLSNPTVLCLFSMSPLDGDAVIELQPPLVSAIIDRLFGGEGVIPERVRDLTPIEQAVVARLIGQSIGDLGVSWEKLLKLDTRLKLIEQNGQNLQLITPSDILLLVTLEVRVENVVGLLTIAYPLVTVEPALQQVDIRQTHGRVKRWTSDDGSDPVEREVRGVQVPVAAQLGETILSVREILGLEEGDVLRLDRRWDEDVPVLVGGVTKFRGRPGRIKSHRGVLITHTERGDRNVGSEDSTEPGD